MMTKTNKPAEPLKPAAKTAAEKRAAAEHLKDAAEKAFAVKPQLPEKKDTPL